VKAAKATTAARKTTRPAGAAAKRKQSVTTKTLRPVEEATRGPGVPKRGAAAKAKVKRAVSKRKRS